MDKEAIQQNIDRMKLEIADMEAKLKAEDNVVLEYKDGCTFVSSTGIEERRTPFKISLKHARYRDTKEQAKETLLRELQANRIEALARKLDADWKADWSDNIYYVSFDIKLSNYVACGAGSYKHIGVVYMSQQTAKTICSYLNTGSYSLDMED